MSTNYVELARRRAAERAADLENFQQEDAATVEETPELQAVPVGQVLAGKLHRWKIVRELGRGSFGAVYEGEETKTKERAALKLESSAATDRFLKLERMVMDGLASRPFSIRLIDEGVTAEFSWLSMTLLGPSLADILKMEGVKGKGLPKVEAYKIALRLLCGIKEMHSIGFIHRDIKPENAALEFVQTCRLVYILDFGMCRQYAKVGPQGYFLFRRARQPAPFRGNVCFSSKRQHRREEPSRGDDLESWFYLLFSLIEKLPWAELTREEPILEHKEHKMEEVMATYDRRGQFYRIWLSVKSGTAFEARPGYQLIGECLVELIGAEGGTVISPWSFEDELVKEGRIKMADNKAVRSEKEEVKRIRKTLDAVDIPSADERFYPKPLVDFVTPKPVEEVVKKGSAAPKKQPKPSGGTKCVTARRKK